MRRVWRKRKKQKWRRSSSGACLTNAASAARMRRWNDRIVETTPSTSSNSYWTFTVPTEASQLLANVLPPDFDVADILDASDDVVPAFEDALASKQSAPASIEDAPPRIVTGTTEHDPPTANFESASGAVVAAVNELPNFHPTWPWRRVTGEAENVENTEDLGRWKLCPVSVPPTPSPFDMQNELQQMRAKLRPPPNMTEQQKRLRRVWDLQGTDKGQVLKERLLRKA
ncbi:hypothetical protein L208DRAFT_238388 [Tricholoma matsutake]|nr:hypothetical protein L208DRAFT_238388 [Tricholoma matsutake 945]